MSDLISRADAIAAVRSFFKDLLGKSKCDYDDELQVYVISKEEKTLLTYNKRINDKLRLLPSAEAVQEAVPTVVRVTMSDGSQYYLEHERDAIQADAVQGEWKIDEYGIYHCPFCHAINNTVYKSFCPNCGAKMTPYKGGDDE